MNASLQTTPSPGRAALLLVDVQNDFFHSEGAFARVGRYIEHPRQFIEPVMKACEAAREAGVLTVAGSFTLISATNSQAILPHFLAAQDIQLSRGDFQVSKWGHQVLEEVSPVQYVVNKMGPSAFFRTELDLILRHHRIETVYIGGLNARRSVLATAYDAMGVGLRPILLADGCADYDLDGSADLFGSLRGVFEVATCAEFTAAVQAESVGVGE